ncbi:uncharacterized [Tachysurus ichikawai]
MHDPRLYFLITTPASCDQDSVPAPTPSPRVFQLKPRGVKCGTFRPGTLHIQLPPALSCLLALLFQLFPKSSSFCIIKSLFQLLTYKIQTGCRPRSPGHVVSSFRALRSSERGVNKQHRPNSTLNSRKVTLTCPFRMMSPKTHKSSRTGIPTAPGAALLFCGYFPRPTPSYSAEVTQP